MVSFRVSSEEYEKLRGFCISKGQRSVSDLARLAVNTIVDHGVTPNLESRLSEVEGQLGLLTRELLRLGAVPAGGRTDRMEQENSACPF